MIRTRSFNFFCVPEEMLETLLESIEALGGIYMFSECENGSLPLKHTDLDEITIEHPRILWLGIDQDRPESFLGLIRLSRPVYKNNALCMASISIKADGDEEKFKPNLRLYERLKKILRGRLKPGVWGTNRATGGEHFYRDFYISDAAISQFRSGRELAPERGDGFVRFEFRDHDAGIAES